MLYDGKGERILQKAVDLREQRAAIDAKAAERMKAQAASATDKPAEPRPGTEGPRHPR